MEKPTISYKISEFCLSLFSKILLTSIVSLSICTVSTASCCSISNSWINAEYISGWVEDSPISVPLITQNANPIAFGFINEPGTQIIFGAGSKRNSFKFDNLQGGRITLGRWLNNSSPYGLEGVGFFLPQTKSSFSASSLDRRVPIINIPFFSLETLRENVLVNRLPNTVSVSDTFQSFGFEVNGLYNFQKNRRLPLIFLMGIRYINMTEKLKLQDAIYNTPSNPDSIVHVKDAFLTKNNFYGFQVGIQSNFIYQQLVFGATAKLALGNNFETLTINGETNIDNKRIIQRIGLFAEPSNIGTVRHNQFAIVPELLLKIGYKLGKHIRPYISYNVLYINNVIRPGKEIDRTINLSQNSLLGGTGFLSGPANPSHKFNNTSMWMQGLGAGIAFNF